MPAPYAPSTPPTPGPTLWPRVPGGGGPRRGPALGGRADGRARHGEGHRGGMKAVIDDALGDVLDFDARRRLERTGVDDALVGNAAVLPGVQRLVEPLEPFRDVVGV